MQTVKDNVKPGTKWAFNAAVAGAFDDMLSRSIPSHDTMRGLVFDIGCRFVQEQTDIIDLGCSRGAALAPFVDHFGAACRFTGLDESQPMIDAARKRFRQEIKSGFVSIQFNNLRHGLPDLSPSLLLAVLTLQFVSLEHRQSVVADAHRILRPGGAMIVVEKTLGTNAATQRLFVDQYHRHKRNNGYTAEQIEEKRRSLQGVLVPLTPDGNESMLRAEGFTVSRFWQHLNFMGWLAVKPKGEQ